ncbi:MAG: hypothetical protein WKF44_06695 [Rubrobacteraceae bacterium]
MANGKVDKDLQAYEDFEKYLGEEISMTTDFDLPLSVLVALMHDGWDDDATQSALGVLRLADLVTSTAPGELAVALPNTTTNDAHVVEDRLRRAVPEARVCITPHRTGDTVQDLLKRAREAAASA